MPALVPRTTERLLEALGADPDFRDALLGDLAEEHAIRTAWDGEREARRWYHREALRIAPYLVRDAVRRLRWRGAARLAGVVVATYVLTTLVMMPVEVVIDRVLLVGRVPDLGVGMVTLLLSRLFGPVLGGYIAATLDRRTPLLAAVATGVAVAALGVAVVAAVAPGAVPVGVQLVKGVLVVAAAAFGGVLRVRTLRASPA